MLVRTASCSATSFLILLQLVILYVSVTHAKRPPVFWKKLDGGEHIKGGLARFDDTDYAFPVADNLVYCRKKFTTMVLESLKSFRSFTMLVAVHYAWDLVHSGFRPKFLSRLLLVFKVPECTRQFSKYIPKLPNGPRQA